MLFIKRSGAPCWKSLLKEAHLFWKAELGFESGTEGGYLNPLVPALPAAPALASMATASSQGKHISHFRERIQSATACSLAAAKLGPFQN